MFCLEIFCNFVTLYSKFNYIQSLWNKIRHDGAFMKIAEYFLHIEIFFIILHLELKLKFMGKLAFILRFILSVYPADKYENRRHIHVVKRGKKKSHKGDTVAKIWIEENGEQIIEIAWSILSFDEERMIIEAISKNWEKLNNSIDDVFAGKKVKILNIRWYVQI